ncbi:hypothetical protein [Pseudonocardia sp.]|uniref:hypothetical protein n=1 Tax=Pseudonocardia sp. TaxID=60912 RepID=UPI003D139591
MNVKRGVAAAVAAATAVTGIAIGMAAPAFAVDENVPPADATTAPVTTKQCTDGAGKADFDGTGTRYCAGGEHDGSPIAEAGAKPGVEPGAQPAAPAQPQAPGLPGLGGLLGG